MLSGLIVCWNFLQASQQGGVSQSLQAGVSQCVGVCTVLLGQIAGVTVRCRHECTKLTSVEEGALLCVAIEIDVIIVVISVGLVLDRAECVSGGESVVVLVVDVGVVVVAIVVVIILIGEQEQVSQSGFGLDETTQVLFANIQRLELTVVVGVCVGGVEVVVTVVIVIVVVQLQWHLGGDVSLTSIVDVGIGRNANNLCWHITNDSRLRGNTCWYIDLGTGDANKHKYGRQLANQMENDYSNWHGDKMSETD